MKNGTGIFSSINPHSSKIVRGIVVVGMIFGLLLLTSANYFIYNTSNEQVYNLTETNGSPYSGPVEEKSGNAGFSISEEMLHDAEHKPTLTATLQLLPFLHFHTEMPQRVHFELITPPPEQLS